MTSKENDLEMAAAEWRSDDSAEATPATVALIEDPFGLRDLEISKAQQDAHELDLDDDFEDMPEISPPDDSQLESISRAIAEEDIRRAAELTTEDATDSAAELAWQIAEDQALANHMAETENDELQESLPEMPVADETGALDLAEIESCLESLLFMSDKPLSLDKLREILGPEFAPSIFQEAITHLCDRYRSTHHGIELVNVAGGYQFRTKPGRAPLARRLAKVTTQKLSSGAMESLAIIAYKQPVLKDEIDRIRGVDSSYFIRGLLEKKLIRITGRSELPGRPMLYSTTQEFLEIFGLKELSAMPSLQEIERMIPSSQTADPASEDPNVRKMRALVGEMKSDTSVTLQYDPREDDRILRDIRARVSAVATSTPSLDEQRELEKLAAESARVALEAAPLV